MGNHPLAALSGTERHHYRAALAAHVTETIYRYWQRGLAVDLDQIVDGARAVMANASVVEVHRAVASLECAGVIEQTTTRPAGHWRRLDEPRPGPYRPLIVCSTAGCLRPAGHPTGHLPDLTGEQLTAQLVIAHDDFVAAWRQGSPWIHIFSNAQSWQDSEPVTTLPVGHELRFVPDSIVAVVTAWAGRDEYPTPADQSSQSPHGYVFEPGFNNGTLLWRHADYVAVWDHDRGAVEFYNSVTDWDDGIDPLDTVEVPTGEPFTGAVLAQLAEDWADRYFATDSTQHHQTQGVDDGR